MLLEQQAIVRLSRSNFYYDSNNKKIIKKKTKKNIYIYMKVRGIYKRGQQVVLQILWSILQNEKLRAATSMRKFM